MSKLPLKVFQAFICCIKHKHFNFAFMFLQILIHNYPPTQILYVYTTIINQVCICRDQGFRLLCREVYLIKWKEHEFHCPLSILRVSKTNYKLQFKKNDFCLSNKLISHISDSPKMLSSFIAQLF